MKKFISNLLLMLLMPSLISSCKKDSSIDHLIVSEKWFFGKVVEEEFSSAGIVVNTITDTNWTVNDYLLLHADGNFELIQDGEKLRGTYKLENSIMTFSLDEPGTASSTIIVTLLEKSASKFTFYSDKVLQGVKFRSTVYLSK